MIRPDLCYFKEQFPISQISASVTRPLNVFFGKYPSQKKKKCYYKPWKVVQLVSDKKFQITSKEN